jgi:hypothetical protein
VPHSMDFCRGPVDTNESEDSPSCVMPIVLVLQVQGFPGGMACLLPSISIATPGNDEEEDWRSQMLALYLEAVGNEGDSLGVRNVRRPMIKRFDSP